MEINSIPFVSIRFVRYAHSASKERPSSDSSFFSSTFLFAYKFASFLCTLFFSAKDFADVVAEISIDWGDSFTSSMLCRFSTTVFLYLSTLLLLKVFSFMYFAVWTPIFVSFFFGAITLMRSQIYIEYSIYIYIYFLQWI